MVLTKFTGSTKMDGSEDNLFKIVGTTMKHFASYVYLKALQAGESIRLRVYNKVDDVSYWKFDNDVTDSVGGNNGTVTNISSFVSQWKFDSTVNDSVGANNLTVTGTTTYVSGKFSNAFSFNGTSYLSGAVTGLPLTTADRTFSLWIRPVSTFTSGTILFQYGVNSGRQLFSIQFNGTSGNIALFDGTSTYASTGTLSASVFNHVVIQISSSGTSLKIYINGTLDSTTTITALNTSTSNLFIGASISGTNDLVSGTLVDEFRLYNSALSASQVLGLYNYTGSNYVSPLVSGNALSLDGSSYVDIANQTPYNFDKTNTFSISCWLKYTNSGTVGVLGKDAWTNQGYMIYADPKIHFRLRDTSPANYEITTASGYNDGNWHNVICTYDGSSNRSGMKIYIDGVLSVTGTSLAITNTLINALDFRIGDSFSGGGSHYTGLIDEVQIWNYVVSSAEINAINAGRFANTHNIGYWKFDGDLTDSSGQGSNGSPTGTMTYVTGALSGSYGVPNTHFNFDGSEYVVIGNPTNLQFEKTNPITFSFWFRDNTTGGTSTIISKVATQTSAGYRVTINTSNLLLLSLTNTNSTNQINVTTASSVRDGLWHFGVITYSGSGTASGVTIYIDGSAVSMTTVADNLTGSIQTSSNVVIGATSDGNNNHCAELEDLRVYNRALSSAEVSDLYTYPDSAMKQLVYDKTYSGVRSDAIYIPFLQGNTYMVTATQSGGTNRIVSWEREESQ